MALPRSCRGAVKTPAAGRHCRALKAGIELESDILVDFLRPLHAGNTGANRATLSSSRVAGAEGRSSLDARRLSAPAIATRIIDEFGGLSVGACGPGTEMAANDVQFYERIRPEVSTLFKRYLAPDVLTRANSEQRAAGPVQQWQLAASFPQPDSTFATGGIHCRLRLIFLVNSSFEIFATPPWSVSTGYVEKNSTRQAIANTRSSSLRFLMSKRKFCKKSSDIALRVL